MTQSNTPPTSIRWQIVGMGVLMAFGLYLTRISVGEIVKSESFLKDPQLLEASSTRFSVELTDVGTAKELDKLVVEIQNRTSDSPVQVKAPMTLRDGLTKREAEEILAQLEATGAHGSMRISKQQIGNILGGFFFTYALLQVPAGWFSDRLGARRMLTAYILIWSLLTGWTGFVSSLTGLLIARLGFGLAQAGAYPTSSAIIRRWFPLQQRGQASALIAFGGRFGGTVAPFLTMWLISHAGGWRPTLWLYGLMGIAIAFFYFWIVRDRPSAHAACNEAERTLIGELPDDARPKVGDVLMMLKACCLSLSLWLNSLGQFCVNIGWAFLVNWLPTYLKEVHHVSDQSGALLVSIVLLMGMPGQILGGMATDWSVRKFGLRIGRVLPITVASFIAGLAYLACLNLESVWGIVFCCAVVSMMTDVANPSIWAFMQDVGGRNTAAIFGWANMWGNFGAAVSAKLVPFLLVYGSSGGTGQSMVFGVCALSFFIAGLSALGMNATKPLKTATT